MFTPKSLFLIKVLTISLSPTIFLLPSWSSQLKAQSFPDLLVSVEFPESPDQGAPNRTRGAGGRGPNLCGFVEAPEYVIPMTALMPKNNVGTTVAPNPTVYVYVPQTKDKKAEFRVIDKYSQQIVHQTTFKLPNETAIVELSLPATVKLNTNTDYHWDFYVICDPGNREKDEWVEGWLERISLSSDIEAKLQTTEQPFQQAKLYADAQVWHETLKIHVQQRDSHPDQWRALLKSVGLGAIAQTPIVDCCQD
ncbi:MAG: DUF928 domain-containing protein [Symploca sp. SIO2E6]|nr:DUF928 domain-containing protein [Symploca sp. SIO2E6]